MMKKRLSLILAVMLCLGTVTGCDKDKAQSQETAQKQKDTEGERLQLNDYRGSYLRSDIIKQYVLSIMEQMKSNNVIIREDNPNSYWLTDGYQDFVATFLTAPIINDTQWFNEEFDEWAVTSEYMLTVPNSFTKLKDDGTYVAANSSILVLRNEKDDYSVKGLSGSLFPNDANANNYSGEMEYRILYDCDKDWGKAFSTVNVPDLGKYTKEIFEYARLSNDKFAIQTPTERVILEFEPLTDGQTDADIRTRTVKAFYYSKLTGGVRTGFVPYEPLPEDTADGAFNKEQNKFMAARPLLNRTNDVAYWYGTNNSMFLTEDVYKLGPEWVFEDGALQQAIVYKDGMLVATTFNKLSEKYERFIYSIDAISEDKVNSIVGLVNIEGLVGNVDITSTILKPNNGASTNNTGADTNTSSPTATETTPSTPPLGTDSPAIPSNETPPSVVNSETQPDQQPEPQPDAPNPDAPTE